MSYAKLRTFPVLDATWPRTFRYFRATPRRAAKQNAALFIARCAQRGVVLLGFRVTKYDGQERVAVNYIGANPRPVVRTQRMRRFRVTETGERVEMKLHG